MRLLAEFGIRVKIQHGPDDSGRQEIECFECPALPPIREAVRTRERRYPPWEAGTAIGLTLPQFALRNFAPNVLSTVITSEVP
jgi:hypothetical protein